MYKPAEPSDIMRPTENIIKDYRMACNMYDPDDAESLARIRYWRDVIVAHTLIYHQTATKTVDGMTMPM